MTFDYEPGEFDLVHTPTDTRPVGESPEVQQATEHLVSTAAAAATVCAEVIENISGLLTQHLDDESHGAFSDYSAQLQSSAEGINQSAANVRAAARIEDVEPYTDYIQQSSAAAVDATTHAEETLRRQPEEILRDHGHLGERTAQVRGLFGAVSDAAAGLYGWGRHLTAQRPPVDLRNPEQADSESAEQINSRGHWRDLANAAPPGSVGSLIQPMADPLYAVVGETAGEGIGATFEANRALFDQVNGSPEDMARAVIAWAAYETTAIQTNPATSTATRVAGLAITEAGRANILWTSYRALHQDLALPDSPYDMAGAQRPASQQVYERGRSDWTAS